MVVDDGGRQLDQWLDARPTDALKSSGDAAAYQRQIYGDDERLVGAGTWADGRTSAYGAIGEAKLVKNPSTWYNPATLGSDRLAAYATHKVDLQLRKYGAVIADPSNPVEVVEMVTSDPGAAAFFEERMRALEVPGYVRLVPKRP